MSDNPPSNPPERLLDYDSLKALSHPLRVVLLDTLTTYGQFTASGLAERLGESSGATSYHLRQLEKHGFVREVEGKGTGRERWWERVPGGITLRTEGVGETASALAATKVLVTQWEDNRSRLLRDFQENGFETFSAEWIKASVVSTIALRLTREQLAEITGAWDGFIDGYLQRFRGQNLPGSRPVQIHFNAFPVIDGEVTPES